MTVVTIIAADISWVLPCSRHGPPNFRTITHVLLKHIPQSESYQQSYSREHGSALSLSEGLVFTHCLYQLLRSRLNGTENQSHTGGSFLCVCAWGELSSGRTLTLFQYFLLWDWNLSQWNHALAFFLDWPCYKQVEQEPKVGQESHWPLQFQGHRRGLQPWDTAAGKTEGALWKCRHWPLNCHSVIEFIRLRALNAELLSHLEKFYKKQEAHCRRPTVKEERQI